MSEQSLDEIKNKLDKIHFSDKVTNLISLYIKAVKNYNFSEVARCKLQLIESHQFYEGHKKLAEELFNTGNSILKEIYNYKNMEKYFGKQFVSILKDFELYTKYRSNGTFDIGNLNWLIKKVPNLDINFMIRCIKEHSYVNLEVEIIEALKSKDFSDFIADYNKIVKNKEKLGINLEIPHKNVHIVITEDFEKASEYYKNLCAFKCNFCDIDYQNVNKHYIESHLNQDSISISKNAMNILSQKNLSGLDSVLFSSSLNAIKNNSTKIRVSDIYLSSEHYDYTKSFDELLGQNSVKKQLTNQLKFLKVAKEHNIVPSLSMIFYGNPGTGKTTFAKLFGNALSKMKILSPNSNFILASRETIIGRHIGETEENLLKLINKAKGGVMFIDEAYSLTSDNGEDRRDFGVRAVEVLVNEMDIHRNDICFIFAGYKKEMNDFLDFNPGLRSRIPYEIYFEDYSNNDLIDITINLFSKQGFKISKEYYGLLDKFFTKQKECKNFGNAREARNVYERILKLHFCIIAVDNSDYFTITEADILEAINEIESNNISLKKESKKIGFDTCSLD